MQRSPALYWLPIDPDWRTKLKAFHAASEPAWADAMALARSRLDFTQTNNLAQSMLRHWKDAAPPGLEARPVRLAVLSSSTVDHLLPAIRVAAARRGLWVEIYMADYGQYLQELMNPDSELRAFKPSMILLALDAAHLNAGVTANFDLVERQSAFESAADTLRTCWRLGREMGAQVVQQTVLATDSHLIGSNEHRLPGSRAWMSSRLNAWMREAADEAGVELLGLDARAAHDGLFAWHDPALWHRSKQEVIPTAAPMYGDMLARIMAAAQGKTSKCLVLDLDNTLWGGVIGDDGLEGIALGQGSPLGEAFAALQTYARELSRRGIILAVCSKNDEVNALEAFEKHPEMVLRRPDIASFVANWQDKASNLRAIAKEINIGLDSLVFLDDNPFERNLVRQELPMVEVPEVGDDPAYYPQTLADAGYFEAINVTGEDRERTKLYQENRARDELKASATDMEGYLRGLEMQLLWKPFDAVGLQRTTQLINKTNQFNLTTRRYSEDEVRAIIDDPTAFGLQLRLVDRFGDNGIISIVIGRMKDEDLVVDTWLMSCRVLGRQVEPGTLNLVAQQAARLGAQRIVGEYRPTKKNGMVKQHFHGLGFTQIDETADGGSISVLNLSEFTPIPTFLDVREG